MVVLLELVVEELPLVVVAAPVWLPSGEVSSPAQPAHGTAKRSKKINDNQAIRDTRSAYRTVPNPSRRRRRYHDERDRAAQQQPAAQNPVPASAQCSAMLARQRRTHPQPTR